MASSCRWAHSPKQARNQGSSSGRQGHSQAPTSQLRLGFNQHPKSVLRTTTECEYDLEFPTESWASGLSPEILQVCLRRPLCLFLSKCFAARQRCWAGLLKTGCILPWTGRQHPCPVPAKPWGTPAFSAGTRGRVRAWSRDLTFLAFRERAGHRDGRDRPVQQH